MSASSRLVPVRPSRTRARTAWTTRASTILGGAVVLAGLVGCTPGNPGRDPSVHRNRAGRRDDAFGYAGEELLLGGCVARPAMYPRRVGPQGQPEHHPHNHLRPRVECASTPTRNQAQCQPYAAHRHQSLRGSPNDPRLRRLDRTITRANPTVVAGRPNHVGGFGSRAARAGAPHSGKPVNPWLWWPSPISDTHPRSPPT